MELPKVDKPTIKGLFDFIVESEKLKDVTRHS